MQRALFGIGVGAGYRLIQLHPESRSRGWNDIALFPANGFFQQLGVNAAPLLNAFQDQKIGRAGRDLYIGGTDERGLHHLAAENLDKAMAEAVAAGDLAEMVECDTRLHSVLVEAGGRGRLAELWHSLDGQMGALMRSSLEFQGGNLTQAIDRHRDLITAVATRDRAVIAAALKDHYLSPKTFADHQPEQEEAS